MEVLGAGEITIDCLNAIGADPVEVERRVAMYNEGKYKDEKKRCLQRRALGSKVNRWRCARSNRSGDNLGGGIAVIDLRSTGRFRNRPR